MTGLMQSNKPKVYIWQRTLSPHMLPLAEGLNDAGAQVTFVYSEDFGAHRKALGWNAVDVPGVEVKFAGSLDETQKFVGSVPEGSLHISEGLRNNGLVGEAQRLLAEQRQTQFVVLETLDLRGWKGIVRQIVYRSLLRKGRKTFEAILAIGASTPDQLARCGYPRERIFPFTYFLAPQEGTASVAKNLERFRVLCVCRLVYLKRVDLIIDAVKKLSGKIELRIVGAGPEEAALRRRAKDLPENVSVVFAGKCDNVNVREIMAKSDCVVLASDKDGWGAVVSEALMSGTPAICSDACGASEAVIASGSGGVFPKGDSEALSELLSKQQRISPMTHQNRRALVQWAKSLSGPMGGVYFLQVAAFCAGSQMRPQPPWRTTPPIMTDPLLADETNPL